MILHKEMSTCLICDHGDQKSLSKAFQHITVLMEDLVSPSIRKLCRIIEDARGIQFGMIEGLTNDLDIYILPFLSTLSTALLSYKFDQEASTLINVVTLYTADVDLGGLGLNDEEALDKK